MSSDSTSDEVDEIVEPNTPAMPSKLFEFACAEYSFMVIPIDSSSIELPKFLAMIWQMVSNASFFGCMEFVSESNIPPSEGLDVCPPRHPRYIIFPSLGIITRVFIVLHLSVAHVDDIAKSIVICNGTYKLVAHSYSIL